MKKKEPPQPKLMTIHTLIDKDDHVWSLTRPIELEYENAEDGIVVYCKEVNCSGSGINRGAAYNDFCSMLLSLQESLNQTSEEELAEETRILRDNINSVIEKQIL